jgi:hypothetical protein
VPSHYEDILDEYKKGVKSQKKIWSSSRSFFDKTADPENDFFAGPAYFEIICTTMILSGELFLNHCCQIN